MAELRLVTTVLPVGPRGAAHLRPGTIRPFALQVAAGFDVRAADPPDEALIAALWPWSLHGATATVLTVRALLLSGGAVVDQRDVSVALPPVNDFVRTFREEIHGQYQSDDPRKDLDVRWRFPGEADQVDDQHSFPTRVQYLATLPGEMSRRLLATIYVPLDIDDLFTFDANNTASARAEVLWLVPIAIETPEGRTTIAGDPTVFAGNRALFVHEFNAIGSLTVKALGPGFSLPSLAAANTNPVFDLSTYWTPVKSGDVRLTRLEDLVETALDPFAELDAVTPDLVRSKIEVVTTAGTGAMGRELAPALLELWRVHALASLLTPAWVENTIVRLATAMIGEGDFRFLTVFVAAHSLPAPARGGELLGHVARLASTLRIQEGTFRTVLALTAARAGFGAAAVWLAGVMTTVLETIVPTTAKEEEVVGSLRRVWWFDRPDGNPDAERTIAERRVTLAEIVTRARFQTEAVEVLLRRLQLRTPTDPPADEFLRQHALDTLQNRWTERFGPLFAEALRSDRLEFGPPRVDALAPDAGAAAAFAPAHLDVAWPLAAPAKRDLPGHGLPIVLGKPERRLEYEPERPPASVSNSPYSDVSGLCLLARRGRTKQDVPARTWRLVTGGACVLGSLGDDFFTPALPPAQWLDEPLAIPIRPVFQQKVARADLVYYGEPLLTRDPLDRGYAEGEVSGGSETFGSAYTFEALGAFRGHAKLDEASRATAAPVLRYGDWYQFAAGVIDQASGLPTAIADPSAPWQPDVATIVTATVAFPEASEAIRFPRTVAVGELAVTLVDSGMPADWPALPADVTLRCREWWSALHPPSDHAPSLLLSTFGGPAAPARRQVYVQAPSIEEHTLVPWAAPALDDPNAARVRESIVLAYADLLVARRTLMQRPEAPPEPVGLLHDPAVTHIGVIVRIADHLGVVHDVFKDALALTAVGPFHWEPIEIVTEAVAELATGATVPPPVRVGRTLTVTVPAGCFAAVECSPLVSASNFDRFADPSLFDGLLQPAGTWTGFTAFKSTCFFAETAIDALPAVADLFEGLSLHEVPTEPAGRFGARAVAPALGGPVEVRFRAPSTMKRLPFVDVFTLRRERWVWRNRPTLVLEQIASSTGDERRRLLASGAPKAAFDPALRDTAPEVAEWEVVASLDRGFPSRGDHRARWPREAPATPAHTGGPLGDAVLLLDDRDGVGAADHLRYTLSVRSRYAGILPETKREAAVKTHRRIITRSRAETLKPPKVMAVIPLTRSVDPAIDPLAGGGHRPRCTSFLVILDEVWFREYGPGERLQVRVALENLDIGEVDERPSAPSTEIIGRPYRVGPLPDHHLPASATGDSYAAERYFARSLKTSAEDDRAPLVFDAFGPFGFSLDVSPDEALANASAFVVRLHEDIGSHWAAFVRFARVLERPAVASDATPGSVRTSELSEVHAIYTLPDAARLAVAEGTHAPVTITEGSNDTGSVQVGKGVSWLLDPVTVADDPLEEPPLRNRNSAGASRYRYFLMVSRLMHSAAHPDPIELPHAMWRLLPLGAPAGYVPPGRHTIALTGGSAPVAAEKLGESLPLEASDRYAGRVIEVLVNGHYSGPSRLDRTDSELSIRDLWRNLLACPDENGGSLQDAAGMIRRVSDAFAVKGTRP